MSDTLAGLQSGLNEIMNSSSKCWINVSGKTKEKNEKGGAEKLEILKNSVIISLNNRSMFAMLSSELA